MPAKLVVVQGPAAGRTIWIQDEVVRLGADPTLEVYLEGTGLGAHAATLEYSDDRYILYNRSEAPIGLEGAVIPPRGAAAWMGGQHLRLGPDLVVRLEVEADPAPARHDEPPPDLVGDEPPASAGDAEPAPARGSSQAMQIGLIIFCVVGIAISLVFDPLAATSPTRSRREIRADFQKLVEQLEGSPDQEHQAFRSQLQAAWIAETHDESDRAQTLYKKLLGALVLRRDENNQLADPVNQQLWWFLLERTTGVPPPRETEAKPDLKPDAGQTEPPSG